MKHIRLYILSLVVVFSASLLLSSDSFAAAKGGTVSQRAEISMAAQPPKGFFARIVNAISGWVDGLIKGIDEIAAIPAQIREYIEVKSEKAAAKDEEDIQIAAEAEDIQEVGKGRGGKADGIGGVKVKKTKGDEPARDKTISVRDEGTAGHELSDSPSREILNSDTAPQITVAMPGPSGRDVFGLSKVGSAGHSDESPEIVTDLHKERSGAADSRGTSASAVLVPQAMEAGVVSIGTGEVRAGGGREALAEEAGAAAGAETGRVANTEASAGGTPAGDTIRAPLPISDSGAISGSVRIAAVAADGSIAASSGVERRRETVSNETSSGNDGQMDSSLNRVPPPQAGSDNVCEDGFETEDAFERIFAGEINNIRIIDDKYALVKTLEGAGENIYAVSLCSNSYTRCETAGRTCSETGRTGALTIADACSYCIETLAGTRGEAGPALISKSDGRLIFAYHNVLYVTKDESKVVAEMNPENLVEAGRINIKPAVYRIYSSLPEDPPSSGFLACSNCTVQYTVKDESGIDVTELLEYVTLSRTLANVPVLKPPLRYTSIQMVDSSASKRIVTMTVRDPDTGITFIKVARLSVTFR